MRAVLSWLDKVQDEDGGDMCIWSVAFKPDGSELLVAAGARILVYDPTDGALLKTLKGHRDRVYGITWSHDSERFVSCGADKSVIVWNNQHEGTLKFSHNEAVQCVAFSPVHPYLVSGACTDFGVWSPAHKTVAKNKVPARCCAAAWTPDGSAFAVALFNGTVTIRNGETAEETARIDRGNSEPIWSILFMPQKDSSPAGNAVPSSQRGVSSGTTGSEEASVSPVRTRAAEHRSAHTLAVGSWDKTLSFYDTDGNVLGRERDLDNWPMGLAALAPGGFVLTACAGGLVRLFSGDAVPLGTVCKMDAGWALAVAVRPRAHTVVVACQDGSLAAYQLLFSTVHGLHRERYAFREHMTDVVVQDLALDVKVRIRCKDLVRKVAVYNQRLAIQLSDRVNIYRQVSGGRENEHLEYRIIERILENFECSLLVICSHHLILCQEKRLQCYDFRGLKVREWMLDALIRYIKVIGGPPGRESMLVGLKDGQILKIFVDNPFPVNLIQISLSVRCLDINMDKSRLAVVDENAVCAVYDVNTKELQYQEPNANSVAWNCDHTDLLCFSGNGYLSIKARDFVAYQQRMHGFVVGFSGKRVFCLHMYAMTSMEVPLSNQLYQYLDKELIEEGYQLACLGATETDWKILGMAALHRSQLSVARKAFHRVRDTRALELIADMEERRRRGEADETVFRADVLAFRRQYTEAAALYQQAGKDQIALDMFTDLRMFDQAQALLQSTSGDTKKSLMRKQAQWADSSNEQARAAELYAAAGDTDKAVELMIRHGLVEQLVKLARTLDRAEIGPLRSIAKHFTEKKEFSLAAEIYSSLNDTKALVQMYVAAHLWDDAFGICNTNPQYKKDVYLPYARWLAENDRFEEAQKAYHQAGEQSEALRVLEQLTGNAVDEARFTDAAYYHWMLSMQYIERAATDDDGEAAALMTRFEHCQRLADIYYTYNAVHRYLGEPFTSYTPESLLNMTRFILNSLPAVDGGALPSRVSRVGVLYTLAKQATLLGGYKLARNAYEQLRRLRAPARLQALIDLGTVQIRAKPFNDNEDILPLCYRCGTPNATVSSNQTLGNVCQHCRTPFVFSFINFDVLPLVEFELAPGLDAAEARQLIEAEPPLDQQKTRHVDPFSNTVDKGNVGKPIVLDKTALLSLHKTEVIIQQWPAPLRARYYKNRTPQISVSKCDSCNRLFHTDDLELAVLTEGACPFCRARDKAMLRGGGAATVGDSDDDDDDRHNGGVDGASQGDMF